MCATEALERLARCQHPRVVVGDGVLSQLGALCGELGVSRALLVSDRGLVDAGHTQRAEEALASAGIEATLFSSVNPNPNESHVQACALAAGEAGADFLLGLGGGSAMDTAKGATFLLAGGGQMEDYWGRGKGRGEFLPLVMVPTTAGTGSEVTAGSGVFNPDTGIKGWAGDPILRPSVAICDPELNATMPPNVTADTGADALSQAMECYLVNRFKPTADTLAIKAIEVIGKYLPKAFANG